ncbi:hypothetical protein PHMEG_00017611 [Phytophthora megakarya]|uniref:Uncharacterized protein n=1 Tax=Phytophthora megakarya TaxID=4795 RepID=A0A225VVW5_9STRA|nr:hypothetical protein PHMEG_00017611 [Phytophthora megakarya]
MQRNARSVATTVATLTPLLALAGGEAAQQYDNSNKVVYAKQQLLKWRRDSDSEQNGETSKMRETGAAAWLGSAPPKFPYLLSISAGDNPAIVTNKLVEGAKVLGSYEEPTRDTLEKLTEPTSALGLIIHKIATSYAALKTAVHGNVPDDFDPRVGLKVNEEEMMMDALLDALRDLQYNEQQHVNSDEIDEVSGSTSLLISKPPAVPVFLVRDFDTLSDKNAERWLRWTHQALHNLKLFSEATEECSIDHVGDTTSRENSCAAEIEAILKVTGNWWSDINEICRRLMERNLNTVTTNEERFTVIQEVCTAFTQDMENKLLKFLYLDGSLQIPSDSGSLTTREVDSAFDTSKIFSALETWKCLETLAGVTPVTSGSALVGSPQQLLEKKDKTPLNCVSLVEALLPFNYRKEGEEKFLDLIDQNVLFLRPKDAVEIGVIPCKNTSLLSPCWAQTRPVVKRAFEKIHRSDTYFRIILNLDRIAANVEMRNEIEQYEHEIEERRQVLSDMKRDFTILQFSMTPAEKATRKAELALIDVELQAKDVYLEKLRSLLMP